MLVGTFEVHVRRIFMVGAVRAAHDVPVGRAGIEPDVERVLHLDVLAGLGAEQFGGVEAEPGFDAGLLDAQRDLFDQFGGARVRLAGLLVQEERDRHAPVALARDAPVRPGLHHAFEPGAAPRREELGLVDGALGDPAQGRRFLMLAFAGAGTDGAVLHADEPLRRGAEDDRRLVPPAVRVAVLDSFLFQQSTARFQFLQHQRVGFPDRPAGQFADRQRRRRGDEAAVVADRVVHRQAVLAADVVVVDTVRRGGVHQAGAGLGGDVRAADDGDVALAGTGA